VGFQPNSTSLGGRGAQEAQAAIIVCVALAVSAVLTVESVTALVNGSRPGTSATTLIAAAVSLAVLIPLAYAKRRRTFGPGVIPHAKGTITELVAMRAEPRQRGRQMSRALGDPASR
jgi:putative exporter of polyketide antibiotics